MEKVRHKSAWQKVSILTLTTAGRVRTIELTIWRIYLLIVVLILLIGLLLTGLLIKISQISAQRDELVRRNIELSTSLDNRRAAVEPLGKYRERVRMLIGAEVDSAAMASAEELGVVADDSPARVVPPELRVVETPFVVTVESVTMRWRRLGRGLRRLDFTFNLVNKSEGGRRIQGRLMVVAKSTREGSATVASFPKAALEGEFPVDHNQGDPFAINRFKQIRGSIDIPIGGEPFEQLIIYTFLRDGRLIYTTSMPIESRPT